jgi:hypothetical protein
VAARVQRLEQQRGAIATELRRVIDTAQDMLDNLGDGVVVARRRARRALKKVRRRRRLSAQGRANIIAAAKKRWARARRQKAAKG